MRRYERASPLPTSDRLAEDGGKLLGDAAAISPMLDPLLLCGHVLKCGPAVGEPGKIFCQPEPGNDLFLPPESEARRWPKAKGKPDKKTPGGLRV